MEKALAEIFGEVLKRYRKMHGLTQEELGFNTELHCTYISLLERGQRQPTLSTIFTLAHEFNCKPTDLVKAVEYSYE